MWREDGKGRDRVGVKCLHLRFPKSISGHASAYKARRKSINGNAGMLGMENVSKSRDFVLSKYNKVSVLRCFQEAQRGNMEVLCMNILCFQLRLATNTVNKC